MPKDLLGAMGIKISKKKVQRQDWHCRQGIRHVEAENYFENRYFGRLTREEAEFWRERHKEAEPIVSSNTVKAAASGQGASVAVECVVEEMMMEKFRKKTPLL